MPSPSFAEVSAASRNAMLSAKVSKAVRRARRKAELVPHEREALQRGAQLLSEVVQGSLLIDRKPLESELGSRADLKAYRHAVDALAAISSTQTDVTRVFRNYRADLDKLANGSVVASAHLEQLGNFFRALSAFFFKDTQTASVSVPEEPIEALCA
jgi:hypothetical protein